jgi:hypothetical protein
MGFAASQREDEGQLPAPQFGYWSAKVGTVALAAKPDTTQVVPLALSTRITVPAAGVTRVSLLLLLPSG